MNKRLDPIRASKRFNELSQQGFLPGLLNEDEQRLRDAILLASDFEPKDSEFEKDLKTGFALYTMLSPETFGLRKAADDGIWRYMSCVMLPDLVHRRAGNKAGWFWQSPRRIWLKRVWWFVHLIWQGSEEETREVAAWMTTDAIAQIVERPGVGFRVSLNREIARVFSEQERRSEEDFRKLMKINTALLATLEPECVADGISGYVALLFKLTFPINGE